MKVIEQRKGNGVYMFKCPGCGEHHGFATIAPRHNGSQWGFNQDVNNPTFTPSLLVRSGHYVPGYEHEPCWCQYRKDHPEEENLPSCGICHSFVTNGRIEFLGDCTHHLKGTTVELPELSAEFINNYNRE